MASIRAQLLNLGSKLAVKTLWSSDTDAQAFRKRIRQIDNLFMGGLRNCAVESVTIEGIAAEWIIPENSTPDRVMIYLHGGGFTTFGPKMYRRLCNDIGSKLKARVLLVNYRLAPEHPFPAAPNDCLTAYKWLLESHGIAPENLCIAGDSAGGNLALVTLLMAKEADLAMPSSAWLISPSVDCDWSKQNYEAMQEADPMFTTEALAIMDPYFNGADRKDYRISPVHGELDGLPPVLIEAGELEFLHRHPQLLADAANNCGAQVTPKVWDEMGHAFQVFGFLPEAKTARREACEYLLSHMAVN